MLNRPACHRAVQRQLLTPIDSIWVSDEALGHAFQQFVRGSKVNRRYGSFVPGPMESRRRLGKRRMTLLSDATPSSTYDPGIFSGWFGEKDRTQWHWEAPTTRPANSEPTAPPWLPWLAQWAPIPKQDIATPLATNRVRDRRKAKRKELSFRTEEVASFRRELEACTNDRSIIYNKFSQRIEQSLALGLVSEDTLKHIFKAVPEMIMRLEFDPAKAHSHCLHLYQAVWNGLETCKVLPIEMIHGKTLGRFLDLIRQLPLTTEVQILAARILRSTCRVQLKCMNDGLVKLVVAWIRSLLHEVPPAPLEMSQQKAKEAVLNVDERLRQIPHLNANFDTGSKLNLSCVLESIQATKMSIHLAFERIKMVEHTLNPVEESIASLVEVLGYLPDDIARSILHSSAHYITRVSLDTKNDTGRKHEKLQLYFLFLVARTPAVGDLNFENILKSAQYQPRVSMLSSLILEHWISQGYLKDPTMVKNTFEVAAFETGAKDLGTLLFAVDKHKENCWTRLRPLVKLLNDLGKPRFIHETIVQMHSHRMKLPADVMAPIIESVSKFDARLAHDLYNLYFAMRTNFMPLRLERCSNFIKSMIDDPVIRPETIWKIMNIQVYESRKQYGTRPGFSNKPLEPGMIELLNNMAVWFAHSNRPPRVAFRNVMQCLHHLRRHSAPLTADVTKAIAHSGITRHILDKRWVPKERMAWALQLIEEAEGTDVAVTSDMAVRYWNDSLSAKHAAEARERNVLQVGRID
jgi:hypothetical protein